MQAANLLTARWCGRLGGSGDDFAVSGAGVWPLLALLASGADQSARAELAAALRRPTDCARQEALEVLDILRTGLSSVAALGIWTCDGVPLHQDWESGLPAGVVGTLTDQATLDRWAAERTGGLIDTLPIDLTPETLLVLASALTARVRWRTPFEGYPMDEGDTWSRSDPCPPDEQWLSRTTSDLAIAAVLDGVVTRVVVEGDGDVDVHLLLGDQPPAEVLSTGLRELAGMAQVRLATDLDSGPGFAVFRTPSSTPQDRVSLSLPSFEVKTHHDLLDHSELFGLVSLTDTSSWHLPLLSPVPLAISAGAQDVLARFFAEGFEAAALSAFGSVASSAPELRHQVTLVEVDFDRPFGFLAVHRPSRLAMVAGWVSSPFGRAE